MITVNSSGAPLSAGFAEALQEPTVSFDMALFANGSQLDGIIKRASIELGAGMAADGMQTFAPCGIYTTQFEAQVFGLGSLSVGDEAEVRVGVLVGQSYEYVTVAHVTVTERSEWQGIATVKGKGRMGLMNAPHGLYEGDYSPASIASAIHTATGVTVSLGAFQGSQNAHIETGGTCRDALASMCARLGGYACEIGGGVSVLPYASGATYPVPESYVTGAELGTEAYTVDGLTVRSSSGSFEFGTGRVEVVDATATAETAAVTWGNLQGYSFMPGSLKVAIVDPRVTPADTVGYTYDAGGATVNRNVPARGISVTFDGGYFGTYTASGLTAQSEDELVDGPLSSRVASAYELAAEAEQIAAATGQYFWHDAAGAHVSTEALDPAGTQNSLWNSLGMLFRKGLTNLLAIVTSNTGGNVTGVSIYDGQGNGSNNIVALFGSSGFKVGRTGESHLIGDYHSLQLLDKEGDAYFYVSDLRDSGGTASVEDSFIGNGSTTSFVLSNTASDTSYTVKLDGSVVTSGITKTTTKVTFSTPPSSGHEVLVSYTTTSQSAKAYTFGVRGSGNVGAMSVASGASCDASGYSSTAEGGQTAASGKYSHAENEKTTASGRSAHAEGYNSTASGSYSHAENDSTASGLYAHSEGYRTTASGRYSHSEGIDAIASGESSHAEGAATTASGIHSHAQGLGTIAAAQNQTAIGKFNIKDNLQEFAEIVGNGTDANNRSNARTLDWNGNETLAGGLTLGSPLTIANGGTGATTAEGARSNLNVVGASDQSRQNARFITLTGATQVYGLWANCINANNTSYNGKEVGVIFENSGMSLWNNTASSTIWKLSGLSGTVNLDTTAWQTLASGVAYRRHRGWVVVNIDSHAYTGSGSEVVLGTLPTGYRPSRWSYSALFSTGVGATQVPYVSVDTSGNVKVNGRASGAKLFGEIVFPV